MDAFVGVFVDVQKQLSAKTFNVCRSNNILHVRLSQPDLPLLNYLQHFDTRPSLDIPNTLLKEMATNKAAMEDWFNAHVKSFYNLSFDYIVVGSNADGNILPVLRALQTLIDANPPKFRIKLTTILPYTLLTVDELPSTAAFHPDVVDNVEGIIKFLSDQHSPLMVGVYPDKEGKSESYATFRAKNPIVKDGTLEYYNLFDAMVDGFYAAMEKIGVKDVNVIVGETGWPRCGSDYRAALGLATDYNQKLKAHVESGNGTPRRPNGKMQVFIRSMFDEGDGEFGCYGLFNEVDCTPIYPLF